MEALAPSLDRALEDIDYQRCHDGRRHVDWSLVAHRMRALREARHAKGLAEIGADYAYRQALVDLAAACQALAATLSPPKIQRM
jgi:hypothetical protein